MHPVWQHWHCHWSLAKLELYLFIICLNYILWTSSDLIKENGFTLKKTRSRWYHAETMTDTDYTDDLALLANSCCIS